ncbi:LysR substrate-binding domain-containing protein [Rubellimicrobium roseum]|uniref:LysR family transcriptional regulator n=1 Tax=Rubellimicrobium roseum TaxID=687525 RepID=A0A5C4NEC1_9RHOB|nr:LysR substrate-binding domain-containing protein [Rubellimicrobium roseum]TNC72993.1 LysR family transcriptional regulator [Rubellimicrobium roseum]
MSFTLRQLRTFVAVAENGSVSGAAQRLSISQSAVSESVRELEADLGVRLFDRHARGLSVTQRGHLFLRHARTILAQVSASRRALMAEREALTGELHLGVTSLMAGYVMSDLLARFRRANPEVTVTAIEDSGDYLEHLLIGGELDAAVMVTGSLRHRAALMVEIIEVSPFRLWLPAGHRLSGQDAIQLGDLAPEPLIALMVDEMEEETGRMLSALSPRPRVAFRTRSVEAVRSLVATGAGVALLPDLIYRPWSLEGDRIESRDVGGALPVVQVGIVWRRGAPLSAAAHDFIALSQGQRGR